MLNELLGMSRSKELGKKKGKVIVSRNQREERADIPTFATQKPQTEDAERLAASLGSIGSIQNKETAALQYTQVP